MNCLYQDEIESGKITWDSVNYFRDWEQKILQQFMKNEPDVEVEPNYDSDHENGNVKKYEEGEDYKGDIVGSSPVRINFKTDNLGSLVSEDNIDRVESELQKIESEFKVKKCFLCGFKSKLTRKYEKHLFVDHNQNTCHTCGDKFTDFGKFYKHTLSHNEPINCSFCQMKFLSKGRLLYHMKLVHLKKKIPQKLQYISYRRSRCETCNFVTRSQKMFDRHMFENHEQTMCSDCGLNFTVFIEFYKHRLSHKNNHQCQYCSEEFPTKFGLKNHVDFVHKGKPVIKHSEKTGKKSMCPTCGISVGNLKLHNSQVHQVAVCCQWCGKSVKNLRRHLENSQCNIPESERKIEYALCEFCNKQIKKSKLKQHIRVQHTDKIHSCDHCGYQARQKYNLTMHIKRVHEGKPLKEICHICEKQCTSLEWHIQTYHTQTQTLALPL